MPHKGDLHHLLLWHVDVSLNVSSQWPHFLLVLLSADSYGTDKLVVALSFKLNRVFDAAKLHSYATVGNLGKCQDKMLSPFDQFND